MEKKSDWFKIFEDAAFYGKFIKTILGLVLKKLLGDKVQEEYKTPYTYADYFINGLGFIEVVTSKKPTSNIRRKWYRLARIDKTWILVPKKLVKEYRNTIDSDFRVPISPDLPPPDVSRENIKIVSYEELLLAIKERFPDRLTDQAIHSLSNAEQLSEITQPLLISLIKRFIEE